MKNLNSFSILLTLSWLAFDYASAQPTNVQAQIVAEFGNIRADDEMAYLDLLAKSVNESPNARGYVIGYSQQHFPPGNFFRRLYGYQDYLVNSRGIDSRRIVIVEGGNRDKITTELWLVPEGASEPKPNSEYTFSPVEALRFDTAYPDCPSEFSIYLEELDDYLRFYAEALRENPNVRSQVIVYPGRRIRLSKAAKMARDTRNLLIKKHKIDAGRIIAGAKNRRRECSEIELWIMPAGTVPGRATPDINFEVQH